MSPTELIYLCMLCISLGLGHVVKHAQSPQQKQLLCTCVGVSMVLGLCGWQAYHSVLTTLVTGFIVQFVNPRKCHVWCFAFCFAYLTFFRAGHFFGLAAPTAFSNVIQLLLTLKLVGVGFEVHDSHMTQNKPALQPSQQDAKPSKHKYVAIIGELGVTDVFQYGFCFIGIITGPYYKYKTYHDMIHCTNSKDIPSIKPLMERLKTLVPIGLLFLVMSHYMSIEYVKSNEFYTHGYLYKTFYMVPMFMFFRLRMYSAWILSECVCMSATLGAYPVSTQPKVGQGPSVDPAQIESSDQTTVKYNYKTIHNIDWYACDATPTFRDGMRNWNMTVQWWLKSYIFVRCPVRAWSTSVTMFVSAYWHGIHPGYFFSFLTVPIVLLAEDAMTRAFRTDSNAWWFDKLNWFFRMRAFEYLAMGFLLLGFWSTLRYWASTFFIVHVMTAVFILVGNAFRPKRIREGKVAEHKKD
ncbi:lysophospholipid acyltransferase 7-like [Asterias amurensis]|uniref:lysophospholipid acyltransferase 7-like n=1 Tax=Asterias amurensis TaxID=7602 RepID=UPI003AB2BBD8